MSSAFKITPLKVDVQIFTAAKIYDGSDALGLEHLGGFSSGFLPEDGDKVTVSAIDGSFRFMDAGTGLADVYFVFGGERGHNYEMKEKIEVPAVISKAALTIDAKDYSVQAGESAFPADDNFIVYTGLVADQTPESVLSSLPEVVITQKNASGQAIAVDKNTPPALGSYDVELKILTPGGISARNYDVTIGRTLSVLHVTPKSAGGGGGNEGNGGGNNQSHSSGNKDGGRDPQVITPPEKPNEKSASDIAKEEGWEYIYNEEDPGLSAVLPTEELNKITSAEDAKRAVEKAAESLTTDQLGSATGRDSLLSYAEEAIARAASATASDGEFIIDKELVSGLEAKGEQARNAVESVFAAQNISMDRELRSTVRVETTDSKNLNVRVNGNVSETNTDRIRIVSENYSLSLDAQRMNEELADGQLLEISVQDETGGDIGLLGAAEDKKNVNPAAKITVKFNKGSVTNTVNISLKPTSGDTAYQVVVKSDGGAVPSKFNTNTGKVEAKIRESGTYTVKTSTKDFTDINHKTKEMQDSIRYLASKGVISGTSETTFSPDSSISRAELTTLIVKTLGILDANANGEFKDVGRNTWYFGAAGSARRAGIVSGFADNTFRGGSVIARDQIVTIAANTLQKEMGYKSPADAAAYLRGYTDAQLIETWAREKIALATRENLVVKRTDGAFAPAGAVTRGDAAILLRRLFDKMW